MKKETDISSGTESALFKSQQRYERMANTIPVMLYDSSIDADGTSCFLYVAPGPCREILELDPDALLKDMRLVWEMVHPDDLVRFQLDDAAATRAGEEFLSEVRIITPSGQLKWLLVNSKPNRAEPGTPVIWSGYLQDITARKHTEERLHETEQKLRLVVENSTNLFYMHSLDHVLTYVSPQSQQFFDCEPAEAMVRWTDFLTDNPVNSEAVYITQRAIDTGQRQPPYQIECIGKKNRKIWVDVHEVPIVENGKTVAISGTLTDITKRKQAQQEREQFFKFFQTSTDLMCIANPRGRFIKTNPAFTETLGYTEAELIATDLIEFVHPDDKQATLDEIAKQQETGFTNNFENRYLCKDGQVKWLSWRVAFSREVDVAYATARDITEKKQAEETLRESEFFFKESQRSARIGSYKADLIAGNWSSSEVLDEIFGIGPDYDRSIQGWFARIHPDDREMMEGYFNEVVMAKRHDFAREYRIIRHNDGEERWVSGLGALKTDAEGRGLLLLGTVQDITAQKNREDAEAKLEAQLHQTQKIESIGQLAGGVAHDFNNMLGVILGHVDLALRKAGPASALIPNLQQISQAAQSSADLTRQLLTFARKQVIAPQVLDLNEAVAGTLKMLQRLIGENIRLSWNPAASLWPVKLDPSQLDQILTNLCVNARDAIAGIGKISITTENRSLDQSATVALPYDVEPGDYVRLSVSDNGCGMDRETQSHIFEPFFTTKEVGYGTGLGLATVYGAVKQNQGFLTVYSEPGLGTAFNIYFPRTNKRVAAQPKTAAKPLQQGTETVLLVEDDEMLLQLLTSMLEESGYKVLAAATTTLAQTLVEEHPDPIQLLISDIIMPLMNGKELAEKLMPLRPDMKVLFLSGYSADIISSHGVIEDKIPFLQKPFSLDELTCKVREVLADH